MTTDKGVPAVGDDVIVAAWTAAGALDDVADEQPFGPAFDVAKIGGKIFMMTTTVRGRPVVTLKCEPEYAAALRGSHPSIVPGYHMNKKHWISIAAGPGISDDLVFELVRSAYELVRKALPKNRR